MRRATVDVIALWFAATVCLVVVVACVGIIALVFAGREDDVGNAVELVSRVLSSVLLVLLGLIAGRVSLTEDDEEGSEDD